MAATKILTQAAHGWPTRREEGCWRRERGTGSTSTTTRETTLGRCRGAAGTLKPINQTNASPSYALAAGGVISKVEDMAVFMEALVGGTLLDEQTQKLQLDSIEPLNPEQPNGAGYGLGIIRFGPTLFGHDGRIPGYSSLMARDATKDTTIIIATNLSASPVNGANAATGVLGKPVREAVFSG